MNSLGVVPIPEPVKREFSWKRVVIKAAGFGAGFALMLALLAGVLAWYLNRPKPPKPWNATAIAATYTTFTAERRESVTQFNFTYALHNPSANDYKLPAPGEGELMKALPENKSYSKISNATWDNDLTVPGGQTVNVTFSFDIEGNTSSSEMNEKEFGRFMRRRLKEIGGFAFFDFRSRYKISLPNAWADIPSD